MKSISRLVTGKPVEAGGFKIIPVCRQNLLTTDSGGVISVNPEALIFESAGMCLKVSLKNDDSWISELLSS